jgi:hypothetical protein
MVLAAGATSDINCSHCEAGTYGTGSGPNPMTKNTISYPDFSL